MPEIIFKINQETGEMQMEVEGVVGPACEQAAEMVKEYLGRPADEQNKPEYHVRPAVKQTTRR